ncbi:hypothetical protein B0H14DRAFT_2565798 [Mycena olivaceomarginata]|nr:hypothetical protein B0H14DRAFT_2565798 [Mycena olivaceomarginata]
MNHIPVQKGQVVLVAIASYQRLPVALGVTTQTSSGHPVGSMAPVVQGQGLCLSFLGGPTGVSGVSAPISSTKTTNLTKHRWRFAILEMQVFFSELVGEFSFAFPEEVVSAPALRTHSFRSRQVQRFYFEDTVRAGFAGNLPLVAQGFRHSAWTDLTSPLGMAGWPATPKYELQPTSYSPRSLRLRLPRPLPLSAGQQEKNDSATARQHRQRPPPRSTTSASTLPFFDSRARGLFRRPPRSLHA